MSLPKSQTTSGARKLLWHCHAWPHSHHRKPNCHVHKQRRHYRPGGHKLTQHPAVLMSSCCRSIAMSVLKTVSRLMSSLYTWRAFLALGDLPGPASPSPPPSPLAPALAAAAWANESAAPWAPAGAEQSPTSRGETGVLAPGWESKTAVGDDPAAAAVLPIIKLSPAETGAAAALPSIVVAF